MPAPATGRQSWAGGAAGWACWLQPCWRRPLRTAGARCQACGVPCTWCNRGQLTGLLLARGAGAACPCSARAGAGYYKGVTQWSAGSYPNANNNQDDFVIMEVGDGQMARCLEGWAAVWRWRTVAADRLQPGCSMVGWVRRLRAGGHKEPVAARAKTRTPPPAPRRTSPTFPTTWATTPPPRGHCTQASEAVRA